MSKPDIKALIALCGTWHLNVCRCGCTKFDIGEDGQHDALVGISSMHRAFGEKLVAAANAVPALCTRVELLERLLKEACEIAHVDTGKSEADWQRLAAIRSEGGV